MIHRDLKPSNVMIDGRGQVVIMDFGLAGVAEQMVGAEIGAGTPGYMAPEQLSGREVTVRSDIYALGLLLYEMFTGKRPFEGNTLAEMIQLQERSHPPSLTSVAKDVDPAVERVIHRCLDPNPKNRPASALAVAAALPGGDPLAAALAAGETPSPDLVAASGSAAGIKPWVAFSIAAFIAVSLIATVVMSSMITVTGLVNPELPRDVLSQKAREMAARFGYTQKGVGVAAGFSYDADALRYIQNTIPPEQRWEAIGKGHLPVMYFWHRESPRYLEPLSHQIQPADPPETVSGMWRMNLDPKGRLLFFTAIAPQVATPEDSQGIDWNEALRAAGIDPSKAKEAQPKWVPPVMADATRAWTATLPDSPETPVQLEAAAWKGKLVYFVNIRPWSRPSRMQTFQRQLSDRIVQAFFLALAVAALLGACLLARHNVRRGRGDMAGAWRLAAFSGCVSLLIWVLIGWHVPSVYEIGSLFWELGEAALWVGCIWAGYMALEPFIRRHWPQALVSWARLLQGGFRDPRVGRDMLIGIGVGCFWALLWGISNLVEKPYGASPSSNAFLLTLNGPTETIGTALVAVVNVLLQLLVSFFLLFLLRVVLRREWLAAAAFVLFVAVITLLQGDVKFIEGPLGALIGLTIYLVLTRAGLVAFFAGMYVQYYVSFVPLTTDLSVWWSGPTIFAMLLIGGAAAWGLYSALAGSSILPDELM